MHRDAPYGLIGAWDEGGRVLSDLVEEIQGLLNVLVGKEGKTRI